MTRPAPNDPGKPESSASAAPSISTAADNVISGAGFLPDHMVTVRVIYTAEDVSDYLTYLTDHNGRLHAALPSSVGVGALVISATDHRRDPADPCGLLWSNRETLDRRDA